MAARLDRHVCSLSAPVPPPLHHHPSSLLPPSPSPSSLDLWGLFGRPGMMNGIDAGNLFPLQIIIFLMIFTHTSYVFHVFFGVNFVIFRVFFVFLFCFSCFFVFFFVRFSFFDPFVEFLIFCENYDNAEKIKTNHNFAQVLLAL